MSRKKTRKERRQQAGATSPPPALPPEKVAAPAPPAPAPRPMGRPSKFTPEAVAAVIEALEQGASREDAAAEAGICKTTLQDWIARGRAGDPDFLDFLNRMEGAERKLVRRAEKKLSSLIDSENDSVALAAAKLVLQSRRPALWRPTQQVALTGGEGGAVAVDVTGKLEHAGTVQMQPLVTRETLRELTRAENEAALALEAERQAAGNREEEPA